MSIQAKKESATMAFPTKLSFPKKRKANKMDPARNTAAITLILSFFFTLPLFKNKPCS